MSLSAKKKPNLRLIRGRLSCEASHGSLNILASPAHIPPFRADAIVFEEDTFLVMSADTTVREPKVPMVRIMSKLMETEPGVPGTVLVRGERPFRFLAIIHDFNEDPSLKEEWIMSALDDTFRQSESLRLSSIAIPLLGTAYGFVRMERSIELLAQALTGRSPQYLKRIWVVVSTGRARETTEILKAKLDTPQT
jgi:hypothetical protein